jgi:hypothetical protein
MRTKHYLVKSELLQARGRFEEAIAEAERSLATYATNLTRPEGYGQ